MADCHKNETGMIRRSFNDANRGGYVNFCFFDKKRHNVSLKAYDFAKKLLKLDHKKVKFENESGCLSFDIKGFKYIEYSIAEKGVLHTMSF